MKAGAFESANDKTGVVVAVATLVVKSGERFPALKLVTDPPPPPTLTQVQGNGPWQTLNVFND
ncbi:MAG: hypothetical protein WA766_19995, partial [Candidatus Acidiferrales bacterium]